MDHAHAAYRVDFERFPWVDCGPGVRHKIHRWGTQLLRLVEYGSDMPPHWCERGHVGTILSGRFEIEFADSTIVFAEGDAVVIPSGDAHRHRARTLTDKVVAVFVESAEDAS